jgi:hypothetical protein
MLVDAGIDVILWQWYLQPPEQQLSPMSGL